MTEFPSNAFTSSEVMVEVMLRATERAWRDGYDEFPRRRNTERSEISIFSSCCVQVPTGSDVMGVQILPEHDARLTTHHNQL
jgi:hypothetical protein